MEPIRLNNFTFVIDNTIQIPDTENGCDRGGEEYFKSILWFLQTKRTKNITGTDPETSTTHTFYIDPVVYNPIKSQLHICNSAYLSKGDNSVVFNITEGDNKLVLKTRFVDIKYQQAETEDEWSKGYYNDRYVKQRNTYGNAISKCYYYGLNINVSSENTNCCLNAKDKYIDLIKNKNQKLIFDIFQYYKSNQDQTKYIKCLLKAFAFLYHTTLLNNYIFDLKFDNVIFDDQGNIILIDFDEYLLKKYKFNHKGKFINILWRFFRLSSFASCYLKKRILFLLDAIKGDLHKRLEEAKSVDPSGKKKTWEQYTINLLLNRIGYTKDLNMYGYYTTPDNVNSYDLQFDKGNVVGMAEIILQLFFQNSITKGELYIRPFMIGSTSFNLDDPPLTFGEIQLNKIDTKFHIFTTLENFFMTRTMFIQNTNNFKMLKGLVDNIERKKSLLPDIITDQIIDALKLLLFDPITGCGILACDYELIPSYPLIMKYLMSLNLKPGDLTQLDPKFEGFNIYELLKVSLNENIGPINTGPPNTHMTENPPIDVMKKTVEEYTTELNSQPCITYVGEDVLNKLRELGILVGENILHNITYFTFRVAHLLEVFMDRPENRTDANIEVPPEEAHTPQSKIGEIIKWIKMTPDINTLDYIESIEFLELLHSKFIPNASDPSDLDPSDLNPQLESLAQEKVSSLEKIPYLSRDKVLDMLKDSTKYIELAHELAFEIQYANIENSIQDQTMNLLLKAIPLKTSDKYLKAKVKYITCLYHRLTKSESTFKVENLIVEEEELIRKLEIESQSIEEATDRKKLEQTHNKEELAKIEKGKEDVSTSVKHIPVNKKQLINKLSEIRLENIMIRKGLNSGKFPSKSYRDRHKQARKLYTLLNPNRGVNLSKQESRLSYPRVSTLEKSKNPLFSTGKAASDLDWRRRTSLHSSSQDNSSMYSKYLKYKTKYLQLKQKLEKLN